MRWAISLTALLAGVSAAQSGDSSFQRGAALYRSADCSGAIPLLEHAAPTNPQASLMLGRCYSDAQQWDKAIAAFSAYQKSAPADPEAVVLLARAEERGGHADRAVSTLRDFIKANPGVQAVKTALADLNSRLGRSPDAVAEHQAVLQQQPADPAARVGLGLLLLQQQKWQAAIGQLEKVRTELPEDSRVVAGIGTAYVALGNCDAAVAPLRKALDLSPGDYALAKKLATCDFKLKKWGAVVSALRTGTLEEARDQEATRMVVEAYTASADLAGAEAYCRWAIIASPANLTAHLDLANLLYTGKRMREAYDEYADVVKLQPDSPAVEERMGDISMAQGDPSDARSRYEAAAGPVKAPDSARLKLARLCFASDDYKCVTETLAGVTTPALATQAETLRAQVEYKQENWDRAGALANQALAGDPQNSTLLAIAGDAAARQKKPLDAAALFERALKLEPNNKDFLYRLAVLYANNDQLKDGLPRVVALLTTFLQTQPDPEGYLLLGEAYRKMNDLANAKINFKTGLDKLEPPAPPRLFWAYNTYGALLFNESKFEEAYPYAAQAVQLNPNDETSQLNFALLCLELGKMDQVKAARDKLVAMNSPQVATLDEKIAEKNASAKKSEP